MEILTWTKLILVVFASRLLLCQAAQVSTPKGIIIGHEKLKTRSGRVIYSFTGIPYAKPPVGPLRYKEAVPPEPWKEPFKATNNASLCPQLNIFDKGMKGGPRLKGQEDCLVLNVFSPKVDKTADLPVMIFVHGGGYVQGGSALYGPELLLDKDIVLVTINYRLGALGFLSTGDNVIPGNLGMKDQVLAIKWVHDNIRNFGGNPGLVTVFGESAGGSSTHMLLLSPLTNGLVHRGIAMSGTAACPWALVGSQLLKDRTKALAVLCGCPPEPSAELLTCMQNVHPDLVLEMAQRFQDWLMSPVVIFGPTIESERKDAFLPTDPKKMESQIPLMTGISSGEGGLAASVLFSTGGEYAKELKEHPQYILPKILHLRSSFSKKDVPAISKKIQKFYFGDKTIDTNHTKELIDMFTDSWFMHGAVQAATKYSGDAYFYYYDYQHSVSYNSVFGNGDIKGVTHSDVLLNLFPLKTFFPKRTWSENDVKVSRKVLDIWTDFAKNGKPSEGGQKWEPTGRTAKKHKFLHITAGEPMVEDNFLSCRVEFWNSLQDVQSEKSI